MLEAVDVSFSYPGSNHVVLDHVDLQVASGARVGLVAPSGFGKTTLCKILAGYEQPDSGQVLLDGKPLASYRGYCPVQMIWQHPEQVVNPRLRMRTVLEEGGALPAGLADELGIQSSWLDRYPGELSGGELQRFCMARALGAGTRYLLTDEMSAMLDLITQSQLWNILIREAARRKIGLLVVSHAPALLDRVCTSQVRLEREEASR